MGYCPSCWLYVWGSRTILRSPVLRTRLVETAHESRTHHKRSFLFILPSVAGTGGVESVLEVTEIDGVFAEPHNRVSAVFTCADSSFAVTGEQSQVWTRQP